MGVADGGGASGGGANGGGANLVNTEGGGASNPEWATPEPDVEPEALASVFLNLLATCILTPCFRVRSPSRLTGVPSPSSSSAYVYVYVYVYACRGVGGWVSTRPEQAGRKYTQHRHTPHLFVDVLRSRL